MFFGVKKLENFDRYLRQSRWLARLKLYGLENQVPSGTSPVAFLRSSVARGIAGWQRFGLLPRVPYEFHTSYVMGVDSDGEYVVSVGGISCHRAAVWKWLGPNQLEHIGVAATHERAGISV